jgi:hypothetical protein
MRSDVNTSGSIVCCVCYLTVTLPELSRAINSSSGQFIGGPIDARTRKALSHSGVRRVWLSFCWSRAPHMINHDLR